MVKAVALNFDMHVTQVVSHVSVQKAIDFLATRFYRICAKRVMGSEVDVAPVL